VDKVSEAIAPYRTAVKLHPGNFQFNFNYGLVLLDADEIKAAGVAFCKASVVSSDEKHSQYDVQEVQAASNFCAAGMKSTESLRAAAVKSEPKVCVAGEDCGQGGTAQKTNVICKDDEKLHPIRLFVVCRNEEVMIRQTLEYYQRRFPTLSDITILDNYSTDDSKSIAESMGAKIITHGEPDFFAVEAQTKTKNSVWKPATSSELTSWIIIVDMDEWIQLDANRLLQEQCQGATMIKSQGWQMVANSKCPRLSDLSLATDVIYGHRDFMYSKYVVFLDSAISAMNYNQGAHGAEPEGRVVLSQQIYPLYHLKYLGLPFLLENYKDRYERSHADRANKLNLHYINGEKEIKELFMEEASLANLPGAQGSIIPGFNDVSANPMPNPDAPSLAKRKFFSR
jgi:hypothetical protein